MALPQARVCSKHGIFIPRPRNEVLAFFADALERIFDHRRQVSEELFGSAPES